jgi:arylsulfatase A-like enzyme/Tfp pilus assembly protein PilF
VLLVSLDTTRADRLGCYGNGAGLTPNLDALARSGVRFDEVISPAPLTLPSHASVFTGLAPRRHGVRDNTGYRLPGDRPVLAEALRQRGYATAAFVSSVVLDRVTGIGRGFEVYDDEVRVGSRQAFDYRERAAVQTNDAVFRHLGQLKQPFFLWVHYFDPHLPYVPPEPFGSRFPEAPYDGEIAFMDEQIGRLLAAVRARASSLVVVVVGDHGESLGEHGEAAHGVFVYQATQRVPWLMAGPGVPQGRLVKQRVGLIDVVPTLLDLLGLPAPGDLDGISVTPLVRGEELEPRAYDLESFYPLRAYGWAAPRGLIVGEEKFIQLPRKELYHLGTDPNELRNLASTRPTRAAELAAALGDRDDEDGHGAEADDPELLEQRQRLETLGYVAGGSGSSGGDGAIDPKDGIVWIADLEAGRRAYQLGRPSEGIEPLERLLSRNPENVPALLALGVCYLGSGNPAKAVVADRKALEIAPQDDLVHFNLANALASLSADDPEQAESAGVHYRRALELNPRFADAYLNYASFLQETATDRAALRVLERAREHGVHDPDLETRIGVIELKAGKVEEAKQALRRALELNPGAVGPLEALATIARRQERYAEAAYFYALLLEARPQAGVAFTLGSIRLEHLGDRPGARQAFEQALALSARDDPARRELQRLIDELSETP